MNEMIYLMAGYAVMWVVAFGFIYSLVSRQRAIQKDIEMLKQLADSNAEPPSR